MTYLRKLLCKLRGHDFERRNNFDAWKCERCGECVSFYEISLLQNGSYSILDIDGRKQVNRVLNHLMRCGVRK